MVCKKNGWFQLMAKKGLLLVAILFYLIAGVNHFINPDFYLPLIPPYLLLIEEANLLSGTAEILGAIGLTLRQTRIWASYGIILMLICFIPSHLYFIQIGSCIDGSLCVREWIAWVRILLVQPLFIWWIYVIRNVRIFA